MTQEENEWLIIPPYLNSIEEEVSTDIIFGSFPKTRESRGEAGEEAHRKETTLISSFTRLDDILQNDTFTTI